MANFKSTIRDRYKGRGNCWVKVATDSSIYSDIISFLEDKDAKNYLTHVEREGFAWLRFSKPSGTAESPKCIFEVRYKGSKIDHPDAILEIDDEIAATLEIIGNTPVKLQLEVDPADRKQKVEKPQPKKRRRSKSSQDDDLNFDVEKKLVVVKEAALTSATPYEIKEWEDFLRLEGLLEEAL